LNKGKLKLRHAEKIYHIIITQLAEEIILKSEVKTVENNSNDMNIWPEVVNNTT
jgi:hypothetical protein